jgi:TolB protein
MKKTTCFIIFAALFLFSFNADAEIKFVISKNYAQKTKMAVTPFGEDKYGKQIASEVEKYLDFSGYFEPLENRSFVTDQYREDKKTGRVDFKGWQAINTEILIKGKVKAEGILLEVEYEVFSVSDQKRIASKGFKGDTQEIPALVYAICDDILEKLTGNPPLFSKKIAFSTDYYKSKTIIISDFSCHKKKRILADQDLAIQPCWFNKSGKLAYVSYRKKNPAIYTYDPATGKSEVEVHFPGLNANPDVSLDDRYMAFTASRDGNPEIYVKDLRSGEFVRVTNERSVEADPSISPDGKSIAYVSNSVGTPQIYIVSKNTAPKRITFEGSYNCSPAWSPKGNFIAYSSRAGGSFDIYVYDVEKGQSYPVVEKAGNDDVPDWASDGRHLLFQSDRGGTWNIYAVDIYTKKEMQITKNFGNCENPSWQK